MRRPGFILLAFLAGAPAQGEERSTRVAVGTLQMTGWGAAQPIPRTRAPIDAARRGAGAKQIHIPVGTLQMTGRGQASHP